MINLRVVLINLHGEISIRAAYLHAFMAQNGFDVHTIHFRRFILNSRRPNDKELGALKKAVESLKPNVIMMSVTSSDFWDAALITKMFKNNINKYGIIWGGPHPTIDPERCLEHVNVVCRGEGEGAILDYLNCLKDGKDVSKIKNLWVKKGEKIVKNEFRPLIEDIDSLPFPDFSDENKLFILGGGIFRKSPLPYRTYEYHTSFSRGCPFSCTYCINSYYNKEFNHKYYRKRSVKNVMDELLGVMKQFPKLEAMSFWDDVFMTDLEWLRDFAREYKKHVNLPFFAYGHAALITEEKMKLMKDANVNFFDIGVQSGSERLRKEVFKRIDSNKQIMNAAMIVKKLRIPIGYDFIFSEFETEEDLKRGLNFIFSLPKPFKPQINKLTYYLNFELTNLALSEGKINLKDVASMDPETRSLQVVRNDELKKFLLIHYYNLLGKRWIPNGFVRHLFEKRFHERHPNILYKMSSYTTKFEAIRYNFLTTMKMLRRGEFGYIKNRIFNKGDLF